MNLKKLLALMLFIYAVPAFFGGIFLIVGRYIFFPGSSTAVTFPFDNIYGQTLGIVVMIISFIIGIATFEYLYTNGDEI